MHVERHKRDNKDCQSKMVACDEFHLRSLSFDLFTGGSLELRLSQLCLCEYFFFSRFLALAAGFSVQVLFGLSGGLCLFRMYYSSVCVGINQIIC